MWYTILFILPFAVCALAMAFLFTMIVIPMLVNAAYQAAVALGWTKGNSRTESKDGPVG